MLELLRTASRAVTRVHALVLNVVVASAAICGCASSEKEGGGDGGPAAGAPSKGCEAPSVAPGDNPTLRIEHDGTGREYILYVPRGIDPSKPNPVVLNWHGLTSDANAQQLYAGNAIADERRHVVAYPNGLGQPGGQSFNAVVCCSQFGNPPHQADDVGLGKAIVADIATRLCVDRRRIYSTGMSNGGFMSEYNACVAADFYAAVAPVSALSMPRTDCSPSRPIPIISFNGTEDPLAPYAVSQQSMARWVSTNGCAGNPSRETFGASYCDTWSDCGKDVQVTACTITGMNHCWPGNPLVIPGLCASGGLTDIDANQAMYDFFERFTLP